MAWRYLAKTKSKYLFLVYSKELLHNIELSKLHIGITQFVHGFQYRIDHTLRTVVALILTAHCPVMQWRVGTVTTLRFPVVVSRRAVPARGARQALVARLVHLTRSVQLHARLVQAGLVHVHLVQAGRVQAGLVQAGLVQAGLVHARLVQAGLVQAGLVQDARLMRGLHLSDGRGVRHRVHLQVLH